MPTGTSLSLFSPLCRVTVSLSKAWLGISREGGAVPTQGGPVCGLAVLRASKAYVALLISIQPAGGLDLRLKGIGVSLETVTSKPFRKKK